VADGERPGAGEGSLPMSRSFVVQFTADTVAASRRFRGRVEHIESGRSQRFASLDTLVAFIAELLEMNEGGDDA
jgi:hypothetical protein